MAADVHQAFGIECTLVPKGRGIFDVAVDDTIIYSKYDTGRYPEAEEIIDSIRKIDNRRAPG